MKRAPVVAGALFLQHPRIVQLLLQHLGCERLDDVIVGPAFDGFDDFRLLRFTRTHHHPDAFYPFGGAYFLQGGQSVEVGHVPVQKHDVERLFAQFLDRFQSVGCFFDVGYAYLFQNVSLDPAHGR